MDFRKDPTFLFFELGLCPKDNGAKKRTHSNLTVFRFQSLVFCERASHLQPAGSRGDVVPWSPGKTQLFCFAS